MSCVGVLEVGLDGFRRGQLRRGGVEGPERQQLVDGRRLGPGFGEAVARGQRLLLEDADPIDQAVEVLADAGVGPGAARRLQQHVEGAVELVLGLLEVADGEFLLALVEMRVGLGDEVDDGIRNGGRRGPRCRGLGGRGRGDLSHFLART